MRLLWDPDLSESESAWQFQPTDSDPSGPPPRSSRPLWALAGVLAAAMLVFAVLRGEW